MGGGGHRSPTTRQDLERPDWLRGLSEISLFSSPSSSGGNRVMLLLFSLSANWSERDMLGFSTVYLWCDAIGLSTQLEMSCHLLVVHTKGGSTFFGL